jgi:hypothetical protein
MLFSSVEPQAACARIAEKKRNRQRKTRKKDSHDVQ